jgi:ABC-type microcin C transport system permease subunit YejB
MGAYILRRLLLVIPTLFGVMVINFFLTQLVPGGPIEQVAARVEGEGDSIAAVSGAGSDAGMDVQAEGTTDYIGARGLSPFWPSSRSNSALPAGIAPKALPAAPRSRRRNAPRK